MACDDLGEEIGKFLSADYRIDCNTAEYKAYRGFSYFATFLWPVGFPLACFGMLYFYNVPSIAKRKIQNASDAALVAQCIDYLVKKSMPLRGISSKVKMINLTQTQLHYLTQCVEMKAADTMETGGHDPSGCITADMDVTEVAENLAFERAIASHAEASCEAKVQRHEEVDVTSIEDRNASGVTANPNVPTEAVAQASLPGDNRQDLGTSAPAGSLPTKEILVVKLREHADRLIKIEKLAIPTLEWDPKSEDKDEVLALARCGFLIAMYEPKFFWFEIFVMFHKVVIISILPAFLPDDGATSFLLVAFVIEFSNLVWASSLSPWSDPALDRLNRNTTIVTCLVLLYGIMLKIKPDAAEGPRDRQIQVRLAVCSYRLPSQSCCGLIGVCAGNNACFDECDRAALGTNPALHG